MIQPWMRDSPRSGTRRASGTWRGSGGEVGESAHHERLVRGEHHPECDSGGAPAVPAPQGVGRRFRESERAEQSEGGVVLLRHGREHPRRAPFHESIQGFGDQGPRESVPSEGRVHREEIHVAGRRPAVEPAADEERGLDAVLFCDQEGPGASDPADREERVEAIEGGPGDPSQRIDVRGGAVTDLHAAQRGGRPKNVPASATRSRVPSPGGRRAARGSSGPCARSSSPRRHAAAPSRSRGRTSRGPSPARRAGSPSSRSGSTPDGGGTSGSCGPRPSEGRATIRAGAGEGWAKVPQSHPVQEEVDRPAAGDELELREFAKEAATPVTGAKGSSERITARSSRCIRRSLSGG